MGDARAWTLQHLVGAMAPWCFALATPAFAACGSTGDDVGYASVGGHPVADAGSEAEDARGDDEVRPDDAASEAPADADAPAKLGPPYPIVLAHGFFGFQDFAGVDFVTYFFHVKENLAAHGEPLVYTPAVDPFNTSEFRGGELADYVKKVLADTGYAKVNLIGHSQGGLDARVVAHDHPDWVASVWTIATPHEGTPISDVVLKLAPDPNFQSLVDALVKVIGGPLYDQMGNTSSLVAGLKQFSKPEITAFNAKYTDAPGMPYFSFSGRSQMSLGLGACDAKNAPKFVSDYDLTLDPIDPLLGVTAAYLWSTELGGAPNDGLVRAEDAKWGTWLGCVPADHLDEIGQLFGDGPGLGNDWDYEDFYVQLVKLLRSKGF